MARQAGQHPCLLPEHPATHKRSGCSFIDCAHLYDWKHSALQPYCLTIFIGKNGTDRQDSSYRYNPSGKIYSLFGISKKSHQKGNRHSLQKNLTSSIPRVLNWQVIKLKVKEGLIHYVTNEHVRPIYTGELQWQRFII